MKPHGLAASALILQASSLGDCEANASKGHRGLGRGKYRSDYIKLYRVI